MNLHSATFVTLNATKRPHEAKYNTGRELPYVVWSVWGQDLFLHHKQLLYPSVCGQDLFLHHKQLCPLNSLLGIYTASPVITSLFKAFPQVHCLKLGKHIMQFCLYHTISPTLKWHLDFFRKKERKKELKCDELNKMKSPTCYQLHG